MKKETSSVDFFLLKIFSLVRNNFLATNQWKKNFELMETFSFTFCSVAK